jgi:hypothetical protein
MWSAQLSEKILRESERFVWLLGNDRSEQLLDVPAELWMGSDVLANLLALLRGKAFWGRPEERVLGSWIPHRHSYVINRLSHMSRKLLGKLPDLAA